MRFYISTQSQLMVAAAMTIVAVLAIALLVVFAIRFIGEMLEETTHGESGLVCRNCKSKSVHSSYPTGFVDTAFGFFACVPYRCDVCSFRFYIRRPAASPRAATPVR